MTTLTKEKVQAISQLYSTSENFRKTIDMNLLSEANLASNAARILMAAVEVIPGTVDSVPVKPPGKKRGPKPGSKRGPNKKAVKKPGTTPAASDGTQTGGAAAARFTHKDAVLQVLKASGKEGMTKKSIEEKFSSIGGYKAPTSQVLLTTLHGMKTAGIIASSGERPNLHYSLAK